VTADEWAKQASRPVIGPGVNTWLLARSSDDDVSPKAIEKAVGEVLAFWLGYPRDMVPGSDIRFLNVEVSPTPLQLEHMAQRREDLPGELPIVAGNHPWYVRLTFVSNMARTELPWPVVTRDFLGWDYSPSDHAEWLLLAASEPRPASEAEAHAVEKPLETAARKTGELAHDVAKGASEGVSRGVSTAIAIAAAAVVAGMAALLLWRKATTL